MTCSKRNTRTNPMLAVVALTLSYATTACISSHNPAAPGRGGNTVLASIGGIDDADTKRPDLGFFLLCNTGIKVKGDVKKDGAKEYVRFSGDQVKDGDSCTMEVRADVKDENYIWYGYEKGKPVAGLLYGSNERKVTNKSLTLELFKLYSIKDSDTFTLTAAVEFDVADAATIPAAGNAAARLDCGDSDHYAGEYKKGDGKLATLSFILKAADFKSKTCATLNVLVANKVAFTGSADNIVIKDAKKGVPLSFKGADGNPYKLKPWVDSGLTVETSLAGTCTRYEGPGADAKKKCLEVTLPFARNYAVVKVEGKAKDGAGDAVTYLAAASEVGLGLLDDDKISVEALNLALKKSSDKKLFHFYKESAAKKLMVDDLTDEATKGAAAAEDLVTQDDLAGVLLDSLSTVYVYGFHKLDEKALNDKGSANWMATITATKDGKDTQSLLISPFDNTLHAAWPMGLDGGKPVYLHIPTLLADMSDAQENERWRVYALKGAPLADAKCALELKPWIDASSIDLAGRIMMGLTADATGAFAKLDQCEVLKDTFKTVPFADYKLETTYYAREWFQSGL